MAYLPMVLVYDCNIIYTQRLRNVGKKLNTKNDKYIMTYIKSRYKTTIVIPAEEFKKFKEIASYKKLVDDISFDVIRQIGIWNTNEYCITDGMYYNVILTHEDEHQFQKLCSYIMLATDWKVSVLTQPEHIDLRFW